MPVLLYLLAVAVFAQGTSEFVLAGILPGMAADLGVPHGQAGLLTSGFALGMVIGAPAMAAAVRQVSPRWTLAGFLLLFIAAHIVGAVTHSFAILLVSRVVAALANAGFLAVALATILRVVPAELHTRAVATILGGTTLALAVGVPGGALVGGLLGWRTTLWAIALLCLPALGAVLIAAPAQPAETAQGNVAGALRRELATLRDRGVQVNLTLAVLVNAATFCSFTYLAAMATGAAGVPERVVPILLAIFGIGAFLGVTVAGRFGDRYARRLIIITGPLLLGGWGLLAFGAVNPFALWVLALPLGALSFALGSLLIARIIAATRAAPTMGGSYATAALNVGAVIGPLGGGLAIETAGVGGPAVVSAMFVLLALALWLLIVQLNPQRWTP